MSRLKPLAICFLVLATQLLPPSPARAAEGGEYLVFAYREGDFFESVMRMEKDNPASLTEMMRMPGMNLWSPRVSPDGTRLAVVDWVWGLIYLVDLADNSQRLLDNKVAARSLEWSGDGRSIYFWGEDYRFYSLSLEEETTTTLFGGEKFWTWFNDGGFEVFTGLDEATGQARDFLLAGYSGSGLYGKSNLFQLPVSAEEPQAAEVFTGLGDNYVPSRSPDGRIIFQADDDRFGSHRCWLLLDREEVRPLTELYSGSPVWNGSGGSFAFVGAGSTNLGAAAYSGQVYLYDLEIGAARPQLPAGQGATPTFYQAPPAP